jgi:MSHA biogenesis protein MshL
MNRLTNETMRSPHYFKTLVLLTAALAMLAACATGPGRRTVPIAELDAALRSQKTRQTPDRPPAKDLPPEVLAALLAPGPETGRTASAKPERMDINVFGAPAKEFFLGLVDGTPHNIVVHPEVEGQIALQLKNATLPEVMEAVRELYGYEYKYLANGYYVLPAPKGLQTRIYQLNYLNVSRHGRSAIRVSTGDISQSGGGGFGGSGGSGYGGGFGGSGGGTFGGGMSSGGMGGGYSGSGGMGGAGNQGPMGNTISTSSESDFWQELERTLGMIIGCSPAPRSSSAFGAGQTQGTPQTAQSGPCAVAGGRGPNQPEGAPDSGDSGFGAKLQDHKILGVNRDTGVVIVRARPDEIRAIDDFMRKTRNVVGRQVILEAKILEVELADNFQSGINWAVLAKIAGSRTVAEQTGGGKILNENGFNKSEIAGHTGTLNPDGFAAIGAALADASAFGGMFSLALHARDINAFIELLQTQGNVQVLSSPRIATLNNQKAIIKVGTDEFFVTGVQSTTTTGTAATTSQNIPLMPFFSGISLDVTPQVDGDGGVTLHIHPTVSDVISQPKTFTVNGEQNTVDLALSNVREADSVVRARDGQIIVIGGMMKNESIDRTASTPFLAELPLIGPLFRHTLQKGNKNELVILLRPTVVENDQDWADDVDAVGRRLRDYETRMDQREKSREWTLGRTVKP